MSINHHPIPSVCANFFLLIGAICVLSHCFASFQSHLQQTRIIEPRNYISHIRGLASFDVIYFNRKIGNWSSFLLFLVLIRIWDKVGKGIFIKIISWYTERWSFKIQKIFGPYEMFKICSLLSSKSLTHSRQRCHMASPNFPWFFTINSNIFKFI